MKKLLLGILILAAASALSASDLITRIRVVDTTGTANQEALEQIVYSAIGTKVGENLSLPQLSKDVSALVKTRGIDDVQTKVAEQDDGTLMVTFFISPRQRISDIQVRGCEQFSEKKILRLLKTKTGSMVDEIAQAADRKRIVEKYEKAGYYGTTVGQELTPDAETPGGLVLTYVVDEHPRAKLKGTAFKGNTVFSDSELSSALVTKRQWWRYIFRMGNYYNPTLRNMDIEKIVSLYATKGYLDAQVTEVAEEYLDDSRKWVRPTYVISEGEKYTLAGRTFTGNKLFSSEQLLEATSSKEGDAYSSTTADADLEAMKGLYEGRGYLDLAFYPQLQKDSEAKTVVIAYNISEGQPIRVNNIDIVGNTYTRDHVIRRELAIFEDDLADSRKIRQTKNRLENLGYFGSRILQRRLGPRIPRTLRNKLQPRQTPPSRNPKGGRAEDEGVHRRRLRIHECQHLADRTIPLRRTIRPHQRILRQHKVRRRI